MRTLKNKIYRHMTAVSKMCIFNNKFDIVYQHSNTGHKTIKMNPIDVKFGFYVEYSVDSNAKKATFKVGDHARISNYKNILAKGYTPNWPEIAFGITKVKNTIPWTYVFSDLNGEEIDGAFYGKEIMKTNPTEF